MKQDHMIDHHTKTDHMEEETRVQMVEDMVVSKEGEEDKMTAKLYSWVIWHLIQRSKILKTSSESKV